MRFPDGERAQRVQEGFRRIAGTFSYSFLWIHSQSSTIFAMFLLCRLFSIHDVDNFWFRLCPLLDVLQIAMRSAKTFRKSEKR
jgi:hypothetical protein